MAERDYPLPLTPVRAPIPAAMSENAVRALGPGAKATAELVGAGRVPPDILAGMTLFLLVGQPRPENTLDTASTQAPASGSRGVAGGVWVREHFTVHAPVIADQPIEVTGAIQRIYVKGGRRYTVTTSQTRDPQGTLLVSNCTTGLVRYRRDATLEDSADGIDEAAIPRPEPNAAVAAANPAGAALRALQVGDVLRGSRTTVSLELMRARDGGQSRNPIHTDPEAARQAGLDLPIAGGSHVFSYLQEVLLAALGSEALEHGACFDLRWSSQVKAGMAVDPIATVRSISAERVEIDLEVGCEGRVAMSGSLVVPLPIA